MNDDRSNPPGSELSRQTPLSDYEQSLVSATQVAPVGSRWKNWRLEGSGASPFIVYSIFIGIIAFWLFGACVLSLLGPIGMLLAVGTLFGVVGYYSKRAADREMRAHMGLCPQCGYDLRATEAACPECNTPVPEEILRRRRLMIEMRPGRNAGGVNAQIAIGPVAAFAPPLARARAPELPPIPLVETPDKANDGLSSGPKSSPSQ